MPWALARQVQVPRGLAMHERFQQVDKAQLARRFGAAARHYDAHARFQQEVGQALLELMPDGQVGSELTVCGLDLDTAVYRRGLPDSLPDGLPERGLDLGCGTGFFLPALAGRCQQLHGLDLAPGMLAQAALRGSGARLLCGDAEALPFAEAGPSSFSSSVCCASGMPMVNWPLTLPVASPNWSISSPLTV